MRAAPAPGTAFMLGRVYREQGQPEKAIAAYEHFLTLLDAGPQAEQARAAIAELSAPATPEGGSEQ